MRSGSMVDTHAHILPRRLIAADQDVPSLTMFITLPLYVITKISTTIKVILTHLDAMRGVWARSFDFLKGGDCLYDDSLAHFLWSAVFQERG